MLDLGGGDVDAHSPMGSKVFTVMAALSRMELEMEGERITDSVAKRRAVGKDLPRRRPASTDSWVRNAQRLIGSGKPADQVVQDLGTSRATPHRRIRELPSVTV